MNAKLIIAVAVVGLLLPLLGRGEDPPKRAARWEYKVVFADAGTGKAGDAAVRMTKEFNDLADNGWEFAGQVTDKVVPHWGMGGQVAASVPTGSFVLFKRERK